MNILEKVIRERDKLMGEGKIPDSLFLSESSLNILARQAAEVYRVEPESVRVTFLGMHVFTRGQYLGETFRIYCVPQFE